MESSKLLGIVSIGDVVNHLIDKYKGRIYGFSPGNPLDSVILTMDPASSPFFCHLANSSDRPCNLSRCVSGGQGEQRWPTGVRCRLLTSTTSAFAMTATRRRASGIGWPLAATARLPSLVAKRRPRQFHRDVGIEVLVRCLSKREGP